MLSTQYIMILVMVRNILFLVLGIIIGVRLTDFVGYLKLWRDNDIKASEKAALLKYPVATEEHLAIWLRREVRILCLVLTMPSSHSTKAARVNRTWGARCNKLIFMSTKTDPHLNILKINISESRNNLYAKVRTGMGYVHKHHLNEYDWFLKADDDTYVVMENLRLFLYPYDPESSVYFGCRFKSSYSQGYMSGGGGYVLSRDALRRLNLFALNSTTTCKLNGDSEDVQIGHCLQDVGVVAGDTRDFQGHHRFLPVSPWTLIPFIPYGSWMDSYFFHQPNRSDCCSASAITFHYVKDIEFEFFEFFLYYLRVFGLHRTQRALPSRLGFRQMNERLQYWAHQVADHKG
ncbi:glycoprotein-N-acetylgalactosamine 3-beta-galactosyltransferase 1 [Drosophila gunungcola]|uniref:glycoprotein-N-acetylgalactosamine 3-beta-galactosyltransferase 1 n=1 Tax=Drosophila gunungcola TaxID=103775 RepID=UPI0022E08F64|nr:glycoprotein-N-acetylgalactosamine 3-beta-galactosyltransferase 1 [Drosophila gunungcola]